MDNSAKYMCTLCLEDDVSKEAEIWCTDCETFLCFDCTKHHRKNRASKDHRSKTVEDYRNVPPFSRCKDHDQKYDLFCKDHECACCVQCISHQHNKYSSLVPLTSVIENIKSSASRLHLEKDIQSLQNSYEETKNYLTEKYSQLQRKKMTDIEEVRTFRKEIDKQLNQLESKFIREISEQYDETLSEVQQCITSVENGKERADGLISDLSLMLKFANNLQVLVGTGTITKRTSDELDELKLLLTTCLKTKLCIKIELSSSLKTAITELTSFGTILATQLETPLQIKTDREGELQIPISQSIETKNVQPKLKQVIEIGRVYGDVIIKGCLILPNGNLLFLDNKNKKLIIYDKKRNVFGDICLDDHPYDLCLVSEKKVAITLLHKKIVFVDISKNKFVKSVETEYRCYGIDTINDTLVMLACPGSYTSYIIKTNSEGSVISKKTIFGNAGYIALSKNNVCCTNFYNQKITCYNDSGDSCWKFQHENMKGPRGLALDIDGNIYVACDDSSKVAVLSPDGKSHRVILSQADGLNQPFALHFEKSLSELLVCNYDDGKAFHYQI